MEQIYYTQCPMGYGLGTGSGFQIKRLSEGHPPAGDIRHLALRAFLPGSRSLAPETLRYRWTEHQQAEVAYLTPRSREYETERGLWGRPGGYFAHGLRLESADLEAIGNWPAGLIGAGFWRRSDPQPTRNQRPEPIEWSAERLATAPRVEAVAAQLDLDRATLARLLALTAEAVRSGRTLFVIDQPERLGPRIAVLTFLFPTVLRKELTLSTYHDRPEELIGFRIQGTVPSPSASAPGLSRLGPVADLVQGRFEPASAPPEWAETLAAWWTRASDADRRAWTKTDRRAAACRRPEPAHQAWSDAWLDGLIRQVEMTRVPAPTPKTEDDWKRLEAQASWAVAARRLGELATARGPDWWRDAGARGAAFRLPAARQALWALLGSSSLWKTTDDAQVPRWGEAIAPFWAAEPEMKRHQRLGALLPRLERVDRRIHLLDGLTRSIDADRARAVIDWLQGQSKFDPRIARSLRARHAVRRIQERQDISTLEETVHEAAEDPELLPTVLDLIRDEADSAGLVRPVAEALAPILERAAEPTRRRYRAWALAGQERDRLAWFGPVLRRLFQGQHPEALIARPRDAWDAWLRGTEADDWPRLLDVALDVARDETVPAEALVWTVEALLPRVPEAARPDPDRWANDYIKNLSSPYQVARRWRRSEGTLRAEIRQARAGGGLEPEAVEAVGAAEEFDRLLEDPGRAPPPSEPCLAALPTRDRGPVLRLLLDPGADDFERGLERLDQAAALWPEDFRRRAPEVDAFAQPLVPLLYQFCEPEVWIERLDHVLDRLGLAGDWSPDGLAAAVVALAGRMVRDPDFAAELRGRLLADDTRYRVLAEDLRRALHEAEPQNAGRALRLLNDQIHIGVYTDRFFEIAINAGDPALMRTVVLEFGQELTTVGSLPWWNAPESENDERPRDLRERFALEAPMAPIPMLKLRGIEAWLERTGPSLWIDDHDRPLPLIDPDEQKPSTTQPLSEAARDRFACLRALSQFHTRLGDAQSLWLELLHWDGPNGPPLNRLDQASLHDALAWIIAKLEPTERDSRDPEKVALWLRRRVGLRSAAPIRSWRERLGDAAATYGPAHDKVADQLAYELEH